MNDEQIIHWLLDGDVSIQYQAWRDLLGEDKPELQARIATEGWGARLLDARKANGHWGRGFYQVKWISSHYSLLDLKNLNIAPRQPEIRETIDIILRERKSEDGGINPSTQIKESDMAASTAAPTVRERSTAHCTRRFPFWRGSINTLPKDTNTAAPNWTG